MEKVTKEVKIWGFGPYLSHQCFCATQNVDNDAGRIDIPKVQATSHAITAERPDDQEIVVRMEDTIREDNIWGFDPDPSCLSFFAAHSVHNNSPPVDLSKIQTSGHACAQTSHSENKK
ncbi:hypothetical protein VI817_001856 [Penicillium citrinum]|nr:hypothetical protein VI817_001856 [Penicillium citrinum]